MSDSPICPCDEFQFPLPINNLPGLKSVDYRVGDFVSFRQSLLMSLDGEKELSNWRPGASEDLAVQMVEWWAYLADILTFYNWRSANNSYLLTADQDEAVNGLIRLLGYRPRPGIGATGNVAAIVGGFQPVNVPKGFQIQSKPKDGGEPQMFEVDAKATIDPPVDFTTVAQSSGKLADGKSLFLEGVIDSLRQDDQLLLVHRDWPATTTFKSLTVSSTSLERDALGNPYTEVTFDQNLSLSSADAADYKLVKSLQSIQVWHFGDSSTPPQNEVVHLIQLARTVRVKDQLLLEIDGFVAELIEVASISDAVWYLNAPDSNIPADPRTDDTPSIALIHSRIEFTSTVPKGWTDTGAVSFDWREVGTLVAKPESEVSGGSVDLESVSGEFPTVSNAIVVIEDAEGNGAQGIGNVSSGPSSTISITDLDSSSETLKLPLTVHIGSLDVSRGETVSNEVLGSGDAGQKNQEFVLKKSPVTYLAGRSISGDGYASTVQAWIEGVQWQEVPTLYGQADDAEVFVTFEDDDGMTHVRFGSPLATGKDNVVATYRTGSGADVPAVGALSMIIKPIDGLSKIVSSSEMTPGSDPDPADKIKKFAPRSILTFGRAVSGDDYEVIAAQAPGVTRARSYVSWDAESQRATVVIYVGDTEGAKDSARDALLSTIDPNRPAVVTRATEYRLCLQFGISADVKYVVDEVKASVTEALIGDDSGLFGVNTAKIGEVFFNSDIYARCHQVPGVKAVHGLSVTNFKTDTTSECEDKPADHDPERIRHDPKEGNYFRLASRDLVINTEAVTDVT